MGTSPNSSSHAHFTPWYRCIHIKSAKIAISVSLCAGHTTLSETIDRAACCPARKTRTYTCLGGDCRDFVTGGCWGSSVASGTTGRPLECGARGGWQECAGSQCGKRGLKGPSTPRKAGSGPSGPQGQAGTRASTTCWICTNSCGRNGGPGRQVGPWRPCMRVWVPGRRPGVPLRCPHRWPAGECARGGGRPDFFLISYGQM